TTEEGLLWVFAVGGPRLDQHALVRQLRKGEARLGGPVHPDARGCPDIKRGVVVEQVAIAVPGAVGESASRGERPELRIEPFAAADEDCFLFNEPHGSLEAARLVRLEAAALFLAGLPVGFGAGGWL